MFKIYADGRLVKDSEIREVKKEDKVLKFLGFTLAVAGKQDEEPSYLECSVKVNNDKLASHLKKGTRIFIHGDGYTHAYENTEGKKVRKIRVKNVEISFLEAKKQESEVQTEEPTISDEELFEEESYEVAE